MIDDHRRLGHSDVRVTAFGLGGAPLGGLFEAVDEDAAAEVVLAALRSGIGYIDTAPYYGFGESERRLGRILGAIDRSSFVISTKVGRLLESRPDADPDIFFGVEPADVVFDFSADGVRRSLAASLARLGLDRVDIVYLHDPDDHVEQALGAAYPALERWRAEGVVGAIGVGMNQTAVPARFVRETDIDVVLLAGRWTLLDQSGLDDLLPLCAERGTSVVVGGVFNSGVLADPRGSAHYDYGTAPSPVVERALRLEAECVDGGTTLQAAALAFPRLHPAVASVLLGMRRVEEVAANMQSAATPMPPGLWRRLLDRGLLDPTVGELALD
jgi:D-threo-aldose 1-dehydrogenase